MEYIARESERETIHIPGETGGRSVRLYTERGLYSDNVNYTFLVAYIAPYGSNNLHKHTVDEMMYVESGHGSARISDDTGTIDAGSLIHAPAEMLHQIFNDSPETMKLMCIFDPALPKEELDVLLGKSEGAQQGS